VGDCLDNTSPLAIVRAETSLERAHNRVPVVGNRRVRGIALVAALVAACNSSAPKAAGGQGVAPELVLVAGGNMQTGFSEGTWEGQRTINSFRIAKYPVTQANYESCVSAGACAKTDASSCGPTAYSPYIAYQVPPYAAATANAPALCVGQSQAEAYCQYVGGRLPTLDEWLVAARGDARRRFSWGNSPATCGQHPLAAQLLRTLPRSSDLLLPDPGEPGCAIRDLNASVLVVGTHKEGASPSGIEDVLLAPGELLKGEAQNSFNTCGEEGGHCVVYGMHPGAIDSVEPFLRVKDSSGERALVAHAYAFRCAFAAKEDGK
jgi:hypothetical protein